jgi:hypothetical protein
MRLRANRLVDYVAQANGEPIGAKINQVPFIRLVGNRVTSRGCHAEAPVRDDQR